MRSDDTDPMNLKAGVLIMSDASVQQLEAATLRARIAQLDAAIALIRAETLEEAARVAEIELSYDYDESTRVAAAIRALVNKNDVDKKATT